MSSSTKVIVGGIIERDGEYLLVQEAKASCRGRWNLPVGHLDPNETIFEGTKREVREETGCTIELTGVCQIGNRSSDEVFVSVIFTTKLINENIKFDQDEILDVRWFSYDEILTMRSKIRNQDLMLGAIDNARNSIIAPLELVRIYGEN